MSLAKKNSKVLAPTSYDIQMLLAAESHIGTRNVEKSMEKYIFKRRDSDGVHILSLAKTWEKLMLAARIIVTVSNPKDVIAISSRPFGNRAVLKYAHYTGAKFVTGRFTPGTFTNQIQDKFMEPRLLIVTDPTYDYQPIREASYVNVPVIAFCNSDSPLKHVDVAIPINNKGRNSIAIMYWLLTREVLRLRGAISRKTKWDVKSDLFLFREVEEEKEVEGDKKEEESKKVVVSSNEDFSGLVSSNGDDFGETGGDEDDEVENSFKPKTNQDNAQSLMEEGGGGFFE